MATAPVYVKNYPTTGWRFTPSDATNWRILGRSPNPNGCRVHYINAMQTENAARDLVIGIAQRLSRTVDFGATKTITGQNVITRASGSFLADGWHVGDSVALVDLTNLFATAQHLQFGTITAVTATTITVSGTPFTNATPLGDPVDLYRLMAQSRFNIPANAGNTNAVPSVAPLGTTQWPMIDASPGRFLTLGPDDLLIGFIGTTMSASQQTDVTVGMGDYT